MAFKLVQEKVFDVICNEFRFQMVLGVYPELTPSIRRDRLIQEFWESVL